MCGSHFGTHNCDYVQLEKGAGESMKMRQFMLVFVDFNFIERRFHALQPITRALLSSRFLVNY